MATITAANSSFSIAISNLYPSPQTIQGYAADDAFSADALDIAETVMGVDGIMSAGFVFNPVKFTVTIMPTSPSLVLFDTWASKTIGLREIFPATAIIMLPAINRQYTLTNGVLMSAKPLPDVKKVLQAVSYSIMWERVTGESM